MKVLVASTGSVATIKLPEILRCLRESFSLAAHQQSGSEESPLGLEVRVILTERACHFVNIETDLRGEKVYTDVDEWNTWKKRGDPVLHVDLRHWADAMVICPLDAHTLAKLAAGLCDNLLTCVLRAWDPRKPVLVCPAMNTHMWTHPLTEKHLEQLQTLLPYYRVLSPIEKRLMCGDVGMGAMAEPQAIADAVVEVLRGLSSGNAGGAGDHGGGRKW